ncbi:MAG TPA: 2-oxoglutarate dehydrogenase E1 component [Pirellulales bacterium]|jgi:2-oxoglutarate dehydrogenase E1 component|nr:2-oxoglutarate dehydrogenase E1 component [Pirellulales bacterium]
MSRTPLSPNSLSLAFVEGLYADFLDDPSSVDPEWRSYFEALRAAPDGRLAEKGPPAENGPSRGWKPAPSFRPAGLFNPRGRSGRNGASRATATAVTQAAALQDRVDQLIRAYRVRGHMAARTNPLGLSQPRQPELELDFYHFTEADLDRPFSIHTIPGADTLSLRGILEHLRNTYCRSIGVQFMHIDDLSVRRWLQDRMESTQNRLQLGRQEQLRILTRLTNASIFEEFIQKKFIGAKSFSLEGAESLIPLLDLAIEKAGDQGVDEIVMAMAHRGRLNVLANIMGKTPQEIFREFEDVDPQLHMGHGDVKYHLGYSTDWKTAGGHKIHISLCFNPSHLEFVNPVAVGRMRAKQDRVGDVDRVRGMVLLIHGDAAFAGEGVVQETLLMSQLKGYATGGTIHVVVNNQIGFTATPEEAHSSIYATDVAKMLQSPIFHVNGEDPEAVAQVVRLAMDFRRTFQRDVVIDMYCYRRRGHNEGDEPSFTQPLLYKAIDKRKSVHEGYLDHLLKLGGVTREEADKIIAVRREQLEQELSVARSKDYVLKNPAPPRVWSGYYGGPEPIAEPGAANSDPMAALLEFQTGADRQRLAALLEAQTRLPVDFHPHPKIERLLHARAEMARGERPLDWSAAEALAFASLVTEGTPVRLSGQDSARGTFSQRHSVLHDYENGQTYTPLSGLAPDQAPFDVYNSPLSETGVLGFEYGYSLDCPDGLVMWEAQFGDFCNAAQVIIDQFIASAEDKWRRLSGLVLLLPHGFEGMGPEHSHARLERFLSLAAQDNIQVVNLTTPAQYFHCLRRQVKRCWRKPLVVMTPKSLLRSPAAVSTLDECAEGCFQRLIPDLAAAGQNIERIVLCSGKIYYELVQHREKLLGQSATGGVAILRLEQLYPLHDETLQSALAAFADGTPVVWAQEEPENMGAWPYLRVRFGERLFGRWPFSGVYRPAATSPATGSASSHRLEQQALLDRALA